LILRRQHARDALFHLFNHRILDRDDSIHEVATLRVKKLVKFWTVAPGRKGLSTVFGGRAVARKVRQIRA
jgi:hypothetical protein